MLVGKRVRHLQRYREIAQILMKNGFGWFLDEVGLSQLLSLPLRTHRNPPLRDTLNLYERIRVVIEQLGPTFIKFGQVASLRPDLFPLDLIQQLSKLQDEVAPFPNSQVKQVIETDLGAPLSQIFMTFDETPVGSASIGQVHRAVLRTGEVVAVKVQRPDIRARIETDFEVMADIMDMAERHIEWARHYQLGEVVEEFRRTLMSELDYTIEARNAERIGNQFTNDITVRIPKIFWDFVTPRVLVMEFVEGIKLSDRQHLLEAGFDPKELAARASKAVFSQLLLHGVFHADPHPGNLAALPGHVILFMDFGMVGRLTPEMKQRLSGLIIGLMRRNTDMILRALHRMGVVPPDVNESKLRRDVEDMREKYYDMAMSQVNLGEAVRELLTVAFRHRIQIPAELSLVGKTLLTIEGVVEDLDPEFRIMDVAEPFGKELIKERLRPTTVSRQGYHLLLDVAEFAIDFPHQVRTLVQDLRNGKARVQIQIPETPKLLQKLDRIGNRLSFSILLLSFSIFMSGWMVASALDKSPTRIFQTPVTDVGVVVGLLMMTLLIWSIIKSGRL